MVGKGGTTGLLPIGIIQEPWGTSGTCGRIADVEGAALSNG